MTTQLKVLILHALKSSSIPLSNDIKISGIHRVTIELNVQNNFNIKKIYIKNPPRNQPRSLKELSAKA